MKRIILGTLIGWGILALFVGIIALPIYFDITDIVAPLLFCGVSLFAFGVIGVLIYDKITGG